MVPINNGSKVSEVLGIKCAKSLSELPDPTHTSVSVVVPPKVGVMLWLSITLINLTQATLEILSQAKTLGIFALWLQPGAEDDAVVQFIEADAELKERCVYRLHTPHTHSLVKNALVNGTFHVETGGPCLFTEPWAANTEAPVSTPAGAPLVASNLVAGVKHDMLSPPSTPPVAKSLKLADV